MSRWWRAPGGPARRTRPTAWWAGECGFMPRPRSLRMAPFSTDVAGLAPPVRSPLMSAMNTGTPITARSFRPGLQRHGLAGAGGAGDEAVAVGQSPAAGGIRWRRVWQSAGSGSGFRGAPRRRAKLYCCDLRPGLPWGSAGTLPRDAALKSAIPKDFYGRTQQMGEYPAPQGRQDEKARQDLDPHHS